MEESSSSNNSHRSSSSPLASTGRPSSLLRSTSTESSTAPPAITAVLPLNLPPHRDADFEVAVVSAKNIAELGADKADSAPRDRPQQLVLILRAAADFQPPSQWLLGLFGVSGAGKSSSVNSILDQNCLAITGSSGNAVTSFPAEYRFRREGHQAPFVFQCLFMSLPELGKYLGGLLDDLRRAASATKEDLDSNVEKLREDKKVAQDVFRAAFENRVDDFDLHHLEECSDAKAKEILIKWSNRLEFPEGMEMDGNWTQDAQNAQECWDKQSSLLDQGLWPFVKSLCIHSNSSTLSRGLTLVDLPGSSDTNLARLRAARQARFRCADIAVVVNISRACDNPIIEETIKFMAARADAQKTKGFNLTIICTHAASTLENNALLEKLVDRPKLHRAKEELKQARTQNNKKGEKIAKRALEALLIRARNEKVEKDLKQTYGAKLGGGSLNVFCIDNERYWKAKGKGKEEEDAELNGVAALRQHLEDLPAEPLFREKNHYLTNTIRAAIGSFGTWMEASRVDPELESRPPLPETEQLANCQQAVAGFVQNIENVFDSAINLPLVAGSITIRSKCLDAAREWKSMKASQIITWLTHLGTWKTAKGGSKCWNTQLLHCFTDAVMAEGWHNFEAGTHQHLGCLMSDIMGPLEAYAADCKKQQAPKTFMMSLSARIDTLRREIELAKTKYIIRMGRIRQMAHAANSDSLIVDCMLEAYQKAHKLSGTGVTAKRLAVLEEHVSSEQFVDRFRRRISDHFSDAVQALSNSLKTAVDSLIKATKVDVDVLQPPKGKERLFKAYPEFGEECEAVWAKMLKALEEIEELAAPAQARAKELYG